MNIALAHYRIGETDGVSLEMEKWKRVLEDMGHSVIFISGTKGLTSNFTIEELYYRYPKDLMIERNAYVALTDYKSEEEFIKDVENLSQTIEIKLKKILKEQDIDLLIPNNILSIGRSIPTAIAFTRTIKDMNIKTIGHHHDFYWERENFSHPTCEFVKKALTTYYPPDLPNISHVVINSIAQRELKKRRGLSSTVIPNVFDFGAPEWRIDEYNKDFRETLKIKPNDIIMLQATRVTNRKAIELAIDVIGKMNEKKNHLIGKRLYNGEIFTSENKIVHVLVGMIEGTEDYVDNLKERAKEDGVELIFANEFVDHSRGFRNGHKVYSLWDTYVFSDIITYPSVYEGWGNQFLEGIFAKKPMIVFEYGVYKEDIKNKGFKIISLGDKYKIDKKGLAHINKDIIEDVSNKCIRVLLDKEYREEMVNTNFSIGKKYFSLESLRNYLEKII